LLEDENATLASLSCRDNDQLLIEVRNKDLTWPEEMVSLSGQSGDKYRQGMCWYKMLNYNRLLNVFLFF
jgi:ubiquitin carboxyl-terminal hydrolase 6/32